MSAILGNGREYDITLKTSTYMATSTSQYLVVGMQGETTTADFTGYMADAGSALDDTQTAYQAIGINQSYLSASSDVMSVRLFGLSKAKCAASVAAGDFVKAYSGISTTTFRGHIETTAQGSCAAATMSVTSFRVILGRALEDGSTNTVITVFLNPQLYDTSLING
ncbi:MAG: hypothetical protein SVV88_10980 [Pseudomonadota bacterium]|nr:hypothetical protein [Pseudomonadota bacterium]